MSVFTFSNGRITKKNVLERVKEIDPYNNALYKKTDDISVAQLFADIFRPVARYNVTARSWITYDGKHWKLDPEGMIIEQYMKFLSRALYIYSADVENTEYQQFISKLGDRRRRVTVIQDSRDLLFIDSKCLDTDPELFNCQNGTYNLRTHELLPHNPEDLLSKISNVVVSPGSTSATFETFLREIMCNNEEKIHYLQQILGYSLTGINSREECYFFYGSTTRNGKSTLLDVIDYLFGDYGSHIQPETLAQSKDRNSRSASGDVARLDGVRFLHMSEPPKRMKLDVALLKTLTGRDVITARNLYEREFQFIPVFKLFVNTNFLPVVTDDSLFSSERVKVVSFDRHFSPEEQDMTLKTRLQSEENISAIFNWLVAGLQDFQSQSGTIDLPEEVKKATSEYRDQSDKIKMFMRDCFVENPAYNVPAKRAYDVYQVWCRENGFGTENKSNFLDELRAKGLLFDSGSVDGRTVRNVIKGFWLDESTLPTDKLSTFEVD